MRYYSPLRYPGGKAKLADFFKLIFKQNLLLDGYYVEPYCGGASIALELLINEYASKIYINDKDKYIFAFWHSIINFTEPFCRKILDTPVSIDEWKRQRSIYKNHSNESLFDLGFATFFLNRTNRSGILNGGIIGGTNQGGNWKIDARFNKSELIKRIQKISLYKDRIHLFNDDALDFIAAITKKLPKNSLIYLDPPYYNKGKDLYLNHYNHDDHARISEFIKKINNIYWIISYDNEVKISSLYSNYRQIIYNLNYSANKQYKGKELIIFSDKISVADSIQPTDKQQIRNSIDTSSFY